MSDNINNSNPFDPASLRLNQSFTDGLWVKKLLTTVPVRNPNRRTLCGCIPIRHSG